MKGCQLLIAFSLLWASVAFSGASSDAELIKRRSQEFSDASALGNGAAIARFLDDRVTFMLENGELETKKVLTEDDGTPAPTVPTNHLEQRDFQVQLFSDVAVTSFTDHSTVIFHGQTLLTDAPFVMPAEAKDVFFTQGQIRLRRIFVRDAEGHVTGLVSRKDGHDVTLTKSHAVM